MAPRRDHGGRPTLAPASESLAALTVDPDDEVEPATEEVRGTEGSRFVYQEEIGRGGMGVVFRASDTALRREVAIKLLRADLPVTPARRNRFVAEAQLTAQLDHPAIVPVHDVGETPEGELFYVMKLVRGRTLADILRTIRKTGLDAQWPLWRLIRALAQVCDGVAYAHARGVVHRDLKPGNLIFGAYGEVWILDWGVAALLGSDAATAAGTQGYTSPEQLEAGARADERADVFSLGAILAEMLLRVREPPAALVATAARAQESKPELRFSTVREFAVAIEAWQGAWQQREADRLAWGQRSLELSALAMDGRAIRLHDALTHLVELTRFLFAAPAPREAVTAWLAEAGFAVDDDGFFQPRDLPDAIREGRVAPDALSWCWPPSRADDEVARSHFYALRGIGPALASLVRRVRELSFVYYADAHNVALVFPADDMRAAVPSEFDFLSYPAFVVASPERNPARILRATPPHVDYGNKGLITAMTLPVYVNDEFVGVWAADVPLSVLHADVRSAPDETTVIVDASGLVIAHSGDTSAPAGEKGAVYVRPLAGEGGVFADLDVPNLFARGSGTLRVPVADGEVVLQYRTAPYLDWLMITSRLLAA